MLALFLVTAALLVWAAHCLLDRVGNPTARTLSGSDRVTADRVILLPGVMPDDWHDFYATGRTARELEIAQLESLLAL